jgi:hypothetical protein
MNTPREEPPAWFGAVPASRPALPEKADVILRDEFGR